MPLFVKMSHIFLWIFKEQHVHYIHKYLFWFRYIVSECCHSWAGCCVLIWAFEWRESSEVHICHAADWNQLLAERHFLPLYSFMCPKSSRENSGCTLASCTAIIHYQGKKTNQKHVLDIWIDNKVTFIQCSPQPDHHFSVCLHVGLQSRSNLCFWEHMVLEPGEQMRSLKGIAWLLLIRS